MEVARVVADLERKAREEMKDAELAKGIGSSTPVEETFKKLEALRDDGVAATAHEVAEAGPALPGPRAVPQRAPALKALPELSRK